MKIGTIVEVKHNIPNTQLTRVDYPNSGFYSDDYKYQQPANSVLPGTYDTRYTNHTKVDNTKITLYAGQYHFVTSTCNAVVTILYTCTDR